MRRAQCEWKLSHTNESSFLSLVFRLPKWRCVASLRHACGAIRFQIRRVSVLSDAVLCRMENCLPQAMLLNRLVLIRTQLNDPLNNAKQQRQVLYAVTVTARASQWVHWERWSVQMHRIHFYDPSTTFEDNECERIALISCTIYCDWQRWHRRKRNANEMLESKQADECEASIVSRQLLLSERNEFHALFVCAFYYLEHSWALWNCRLRGAFNN